MEKYILHSDINYLNYVLCFTINNVVLRSRRKNSQANDRDRFQNILK